MTARIKVSELPPATALAGSEQIPVVQAGETRRTTPQQLAEVPVLVEAGASRTLALADMGTLIRCTDAGGCTVALPSDSTLAVPVGSVVGFVQEGAAQVILSAGGGATLHIEAAFLPRTLAQRAMVFAFKLAADTWTVGGSRASS